MLSQAAQGALGLGLKSESCQKEGENDVPGLTFQKEPRGPRCRESLNGNRCWWEGPGNRKDGAKLCKYL